MKKNKSNRGEINIDIGVDLDGVIIDHTRNKIRVAKSLGFKIKAKETPSEILKKILPKEKYKKLQKKIYGEITMKAPPMPRALKCIQKFSRRKNCNLYIISRRKTPKIALNWLKKYGVLENIPASNIFFVREDKDKNKIAKKLKIKVYLDDKTSVLENISSAPHPVFFNHYRIRGNKKFLEVESWREFYKLMKKKRLP